MNYYLIFGLTAFIVLAEVRNWHYRDYLKRNRNSNDDLKALLLAAKKKKKKKDGT
jgi:hypothetical protein